MAKGKVDGMNVEDVAEQGLDTSTDLTDFGVGQDAQVSEQMAGYSVEIDGWVEELAHLHTYHSVHILIALKG